MRLEECLKMLTASSDGLHAAYQSVVDDWAPEEVPVTLLFGVLGDQISDDLSRHDTPTNQRVFEVVELAMNSGDESLVTAVATGLIEALINRSQRTGKWRRVAPFLGPTSTKYAEAWLSF